MRIIACNHCGMSHVCELIIELYHTYYNTCSIQYKCVNKLGYKTDCYVYLYTVIILQFDSFLIVFLK